MSPLLVGLSLGLASSVHCIAMCGPLLAAIGRSAPASRRARVLQAGLHHAARTCAYAALAALAGLAGEGLAVRGFGSALACVAGISLLLGVLGSARLRVFGRIGDAIASRIVRSSTPVLRWAHRRTVLGPLVTGVLNGLLPCGMVYGALTAAAATGRMASAVLLMTGFGFGTAAILIAMTMAAASVPASLRLRLRPVAPLVMALAAVILIARGLSAPHEHASGGTVTSAPAHAHIHE